MSTYRTFSNEMDLGEALNLWANVAYVEDQEFNLQDIGISIVDILDAMKKQNVAYVQVETPFGPEEWDFEETIN